MGPNYHVVVLELRGTVRERYLEFRDAIGDHKFWGTRLVGIDTGGVDYSPDRTTIDLFVDPIIVVCTKDEPDEEFPAPESIVAYVVVNRLMYDGVVRVLVPRGLTKTPVGHGAEYGYSFQLSRGSSSTRPCSRGTRRRSIDSGENQR